MMRTLLTLLLLLLSAAGFAEPAQGFYVAGGAAKQQLDARLRSNEIFDGTPITIDASSSLDGSGGTLLAGYQLSFGANGAALLEAGADFGGSSAFSAHGEAAGDSLDAHWKVTRSWFLAVKPGMRVGEKMLAYISVAYHVADVNFSRTVVGSQNNTRSGARTMGGVGLGLGLQGQINNRFFVRGEIEGIRYASATFDYTSSADSVSRHSIKPDALVGRVIVGYWF